MGDKLKALRLEMNLTQKQVADRVGVVASAISSYEAGTRYPSYAALIKLASIYHVSCDYLVGLDKTRNVDVTGLSEDEIRIVMQTVDILRNKHS